MTFIFGFIYGIASLAIVVYPIIYLILKKKNPKIKFWKTEGIIFATMLVAGAVSISNQSADKPKSKTPRTSQINKSPSQNFKTKYSSSANQVNKEQPDYTSMNAQLATELAQDKGFANGTLDENGNPTEQGTPNPNFEFANYIESVKFEGHLEVVVNVSSDFMPLPPESKDQIASRVRLFARSVLPSSEEMNDNIHLTFMLGNRQIGRTSIVQNDHFTWKKISSYY